MYSLLADCEQQENHFSQAMCAFQFSVYILCLIFCQPNQLQLKFKHAQKHKHIHKHTIARNTVYTKGHVKQHKIDQTQYLQPHSLFVKCDHRLKLHPWEKTEMIAANHLNSSFWTEWTRLNHLKSSLWTEWAKLQPSKSSLWTEWAKLRPSEVQLLDRTSPAASPLKSDFCTNQVQLPALLGHNSGQMSRTAYPSTVKF